MGVGFKALTRVTADLSLGYSHNIVFEIPSELKVATARGKGENPKITLEGIDKQLLGQVAKQTAACVSQSLTKVKVLNTLVKLSVVKRVKQPVNNFQFENLRMCQSANIGPDGKSIQFSNFQIL